MNTYAIEALHRDEGTVVLFEGHADPQPGEGGDVPLGKVLIAVDHRMAQAIVNALWDGEPVIVEVEDWQIVGTVR
jgi:hypothetical protein